MRPPRRAFIRPGWFVLILAAASAVSMLSAASAPDAKPGPKGEPQVKKIVMLAGPKSHAAGMHDHAGGLALLKGAMEKAYGSWVKIDLIEKGWFDDPALLEGAAAHLQCHRWESDR